MLGNLVMGQQAIGHGLAQHRITARGVKPDGSAVHREPAGSARILGQPGVDLDERLAGGYPVTGQRNMKCNKHGKCKVEYYDARYDRDGRHRYGNVRYDNYGRWWDGRRWRDRDDRD